MFSSFYRSVVLWEWSGTNASYTAVSTIFFFFLCAPFALIFLALLNLFICWTFYRRCRCYSCRIFNVDFFMFVSYIFFVAFFFSGYIILPISTALSLLTRFFLKLRTSHSLRCRWILSLSPYHGALPLAKCMLETSDILFFIQKAISLVSVRSIKYDVKNAFCLTVQISMHDMLFSDP